MSFFEYSAQTHLDTIQAGHIQAGRPGNIDSGYVNSGHIDLR